MSSLKKLAIRGAIWTLFSYGAIQGLRFGSNLVLTHLALKYQGILAGIIVIALNDLPLYVVISYGMWRNKLTCFLDDLQLTLLFVSLLIVALAFRSLLGLETPFINLLAF